jgi:hypothetical protein
MRQQALPLKIDRCLSKRPENSKILPQNVSDVLKQCCLMIDPCDILTVFGAIFLSGFENSQAFCSIRVAKFLFPEDQHKMHAALRTRSKTL